MNIQDLYEIYKQRYKVDTDTRTIRKDSLFFALKGPNFNGNLFANEALKKGAAFCVIDEEAYSVKGKTILVENSLTALQKLAQYHRKQLHIPIIGLTGSNGKTTTKELIGCVLSKKYKTLATSGNLNNHIGVPQTLLSITPDIEIGIIEMGANHQKEIEFLSSLCLPDFGLITNFGKAHIEGFGGVKGVIKGKSELYQNIRSHNKKVFVNESDPKQIELTTDLHRILFNPSTIELISENPFLQLKHKNLSFQTQLIGSYNIPNIAAAISIGNYFNIPLQQAVEAIESYLPTNNRSQLIKTKNNTIHLDAYNANPSSVSLALKSFSRIESKNKVVVLGDMFELGEESFNEHKNMHDLALSLNFSEVILIGNQYAKIVSKLPIYKTIEEFVEVLKQKPIHNKTILIKGSRGMKMERLLESID